MSFLLKRSPELVWAGFFDTFDRPVENPVQRPWVHLGDGTPADINNIAELHIPSNYSTTNGGGESYEFQPFTPNWGFDATFWFPPTGVASQGFSFYLTDSWARIDALFQNVVGVRLIYQTPAAGGDIVQVGQLATPVSAVTNRGQWSSPVVFNGNTLQLRVWVDADQFIRIWLNGVYVGAAVTTPAYRTGPDRRCIRLLNSAACDVWLREFFCYDRVSDVVSGPWSSVFYDNFDRANGAPGNGWTVVGATGQISANAYAKTGTTDGGAAILRNTGLTGGVMRVDATIKTATAHEHAIILHANAAGTQGLACRVTTGNAKLFRFSTVLSGNPPTWTQLGSFSAPSTNNAAGHVIRAETRPNGSAYVWRGDELLAWADSVFATGVAATNPYAGVFVSRASFVNSGQWDDGRLLAAA